MGQLTIMQMQESGSLKKFIMIDGIYYDYLISSSSRNLKDDIFLYFTVLFDFT